MFVKYILLEGVGFMKKFASENAPKAIGPYTQAIGIGNLVFVSGQLPVNPVNGEIPATIEEQTLQSIKNIEAILKEADLTLQHVVKTTCFLKDMGDFQAFNHVYGEYFAHGPARSCVAVREIPKDVLCEIEVIASY